MDKKDPTRNSEQLGNLLLRYKKIFKPPQQSVLKEVVVVIKETLGFEVQLHQFEYTVSSRVVYVRTPSILKTEILKNKALIKKALIERLGESHSPLDFI